MPLLARVYSCIGGSDSDRHGERVLSRGRISYKISDEGEELVYAGEVQLEARYSGNSFELFFDGREDILRKISCLFSKADRNFPSITAQLPAQSDTRAANIPAPFQIVREIADLIRRIDADKEFELSE